MPTTRDELALLVPGIRTDGARVAGWLAFAGLAFVGAVVAWAVLVAPALWRGGARPGVVQEERTANGGLHGR